MEYSLIMASVISIGHLSTTALAATSLGYMTASVSGFSVIQGFTSALDTILPPAWTSSQPKLVGLWVQRMSIYITSIRNIFVHRALFFCTAIVMSVLLMVYSEHYYNLAHLRRHRSLYFLYGLMRRASSYSLNKIPRLLA